MAGSTDTATINGWGGPALLASYERERRARALIDRELLARALETRRRFGRLAAAGAARELLADVLRQEAHQPGAGDLSVRHATSAVVWHDGDPAASVHPGGRAPAVRLADHSQLFDRLGYHPGMFWGTSSGLPGIYLPIYRARCRAQRSYPPPGDEPMTTLIVFP